MLDSSSIKTVTLKVLTGSSEKKKINLSKPDFFCLRVKEQVNFQSQNITYFVLKQVLMRKIRANVKHLIFDET